MKLKDTGKLPKRTFTGWEHEEKTYNCTLKYWKEIGEIDLTEAFEVWAKENNYHKATPKERFDYEFKLWCEKQAKIQGYIKLSDMELCDKCKEKLNGN